MTADSEPAVWEMVVVHKVFRRELRLAPELVREVRPGDTVRASVLAGYLGNLLTGLHHHHEAEDKLLWPLLLDRVTIEADLIRTMETQHERVAAHLTVLEGLLPRWRETADAERGGKIADALDLLREELLEHLAQEEERILPLVSRHLTKAEWNTLSEHARSHTPKERALTQLGSLLEDATQAEREAFLALLPLPARMAWMMVGRRQYRQLCLEIRGRAA